jgi:cystathionine beta-lyase/cystathionine gamma-synthase
MLESHPDHALAKRLLAGGGGVVSFVAHGDAGRGRRVLEALGLITHAASLGGVESLACLPELTSHAGLTADELRDQGIAPGTVRLALGIEDAEDLIADLDQALAASRRG